MEEEIKTMFDEPAEGEQEPENAGMGSGYDPSAEEVPE